MAIRYLNDVGGRFKVPLKDDDGKTVAHLLWGDTLHVGASSGGHVKVRARGKTKEGEVRQGWIPKSAVTDESLLEVYVIDVGQGDGVLMRTPDDAWHLIDAGVSNEAQMTKKGAANFIRWKFLDDLERDAVKLDTVTVTHPDFDHYGGLLNLLSGQLPGRPPFPVEVGAFYHCGMARFEDEPKLGKVVAGTVPAPPFPDYGVDPDGQFITELLDKLPSFKEDPDRPFKKEFAALAKLVRQKAAKAARLSYRNEYLPGYGPDDGTGVTIRLLGPIVEEVAGVGPGLRWLSDESKTRNGHSVVMRVEFGDARLLLTGDLNTASQRLLLSYHKPLEFAADVAKGCHHGSDDIDLRFVKAMRARATVISSGDNEDYAHPRPRIVGASARYGRESKALTGTEVYPPLIYSTELARSVTLAYAAAVRPTDDDDGLLKAGDAEVKADVKKAKFVPFSRVPLATNLVYGLINVRTDGKRILCAYMKEATEDFDIKVFRAGVDPA